MACSDVVRSTLETVEPAVAVAPVVVVVTSCCSPDRKLRLQTAVERYWETVLNHR